MGLEAFFTTHLFEFIDIELVCWIHWSLGTVIPSSVLYCRLWLPEMRKDKKISLLYSIVSFYITFESIELHSFRANPCGMLAYGVEKTVCLLLPLVFSFVRSNTSKSVILSCAISELSGNSSWKPFGNPVYSYQLKCFSRSLLVPPVCDHSFLLYRATWTLLNYVVFQSLSVLFYIEVIPVCQQKYYILVSDSPDSYQPPQKLPPW